uniref:Uncharacterized protein n=1 Tax=Arundo donax TaxID=35708 RepID=A0A0A8Z662_ARUDO
MGSMGAMTSQNH